MGNDGSHEPPSERGLDEALRAAFESRSGDSVLKRIEDLTGVKSRILIHDDAEDPSPMIRVQGLESEPAEDDSRYQIVGEIARGGVGVVHKARDRDLGRDVALKVLRQDFADNAGVFARFIEEAQIGGQLQHPGIVPVYGMGLQPDGRPSFAMKLIKGRTLAAALKERKSPAEDRRRFLAIFEQVALTMGYAHARGVIHRDLKPSNILVGNFGEVLVVDWGFGKVLGRPEPEKPETTIVATVRSTGEGSESLAGSVMGTPAYMPPEQALGQVEEMDEQSDVFALGSILTEILTGKPAYAGESRDLLVMAARANLDDAFERLEACEAEPAMVDLARRCLAPLRKDRPDDAMAVAKEVGEHLTAAEERARQAELSAVEEKARLERETKQAAWERRARRKVLALAACVLVAVLVGGGAYFKLDSDRRSRAEAARPAVEQAIEEATRLGGQGKWTEAIAVARKAVALAEEADEETRDRASGVLCDAEEGLGAANAEEEQAQKDSVLLAALRGVSIAWGQESEFGGRDQEFATAFERWGLDLTELDIAGAGELIRSRGAELASEVAAALDDLIWLRREILQKEPAEWEPLVALADASAPDEMHQRLRKSVLDFDRESLLRIAASEEALGLPSRSQRLLGFGLWALGEPRDAAGFLRRALRVHPDDHALLSLLGATVRTFAPEEAIRCFTAAIAVRPEGTESRLWLSYALQKIRRLPEAIEVVRDALRSAPQETRLRWKLSELLLESGEQDAALEMAREALRLHPDDRSAQAALSNVLAELWQVEDRLEAIRAGLDSAPSITCLGRGLVSKYAFTEAREVLDEAVENYPDYAPARFQLGIARHGSSRLDSAIEAYREALRLGSGQEGFQASVRRNLGAALLLKGRLDEALASFREAVRLAPWDPGPCQLYSRELSMLGQYEEAVYVARRMIRLQPDGVQGYAGLGTALKAAGRLDEAVEAYRHGVRIAPEYHGSHYNLGLGLQAAGRLEEAVQAYREALRLDPEDASSHCQLGKTLMRLGRFEEALAPLRRGHELGSTSGRLWPYPSGDWVALGVRLLELERRLLDEGEAALDAGDLELAAEMRFYQGQYGAAARLFRECLPDPTKGTAQSLTTAGQAAALAGCGIGASPPGDADRPEWRRQALNWLREAVEHRKSVAGIDPVGIRTTLLNLTCDPYLSCVRDRELLDQLPTTDQDAWQAFWRDIEAHIEELEPDRAVLHFNLGKRLENLKLDDGAIHAYHVASELRPDWAEAHNRLALVLSRAGRHDEAIEAARTAVRLAPDRHSTVGCLGSVLAHAGRQEEAIEQHRRASQLDSVDPTPLVNLGLALQQLGRFEEAVAAFGEALLRNPTRSSTLRRLASAQLRLGEISKALESQRRARELGKGPADDILIRLYERLLELEPRLHEFLSDRDRPEDALEKAHLALLCYYKSRFAASATLFHEAFQEDSAIEENFQLGWRTLAAYASVRAGSGHGISPQSDEKDRAVWRARAREWLESDLAGDRKLILMGWDTVIAVLEQWLAQFDLAPVRDAEALAKLPEAERAEWAAFWEEVRKTIAAAREVK